MAEHIRFSLKDIQNSLAKDAFGMTKAEAHRDRICIQCKEPVEDRIYSDAGAREYKISGLCELCFDDITLPPEE